MKVLDILLVEDNPGDIRLTQEAMREAKMSNNLHVTKNGMAAMDFLRRRGDFPEAPRPDLVLLDLNLPRLSGREVLKQMKDDPELRRIPVIVLSTSDAQRDVSESYDLHANCYINKPVDFDQFLGAIDLIEKFWFGLVKLPKL
jgi:chemotaxis family two-component system response regulator Rcp1